MSNPTPESLICPHCGGSGKTGAYTDSDVGIILYRERRAAHVSVERLAHAMECSWWRVEDIECGGRLITQEIIAAYRAALAKAKEAARG